MLHKSSTGLKMPLNDIEFYQILRNDLRHPQLLCAPQGSKERPELCGAQQQKAVAGHCKA